MNMTLNENERKLVEENLYIVEQVIRKNIRINDSICGMEYDDIFQIGAIGLCKAVRHYEVVPGAKFETYAYRVIRNTILDHLKNVLRRQDAYTMYLQDREHYITGDRIQEPDEVMGEHVAIQALEESKVRYTGTAKTGIEAITLKVRGYNGADIAERFGVNTNYIAACVSRAKKYLKKDKQFLKMIG